MPKRSGKVPDQLSLDLSPPKEGGKPLVQSAPATSSVVRFVDASTVALRQEAVRRVREAAIFALPSSLDRRR